MPMPTPEQRIARAAAALEAGFATQAAKKDAMGDLSWAYETATRVIKDACLDTRAGADRMSPEVEAAYDAVPYSVAHWRPKHAEAVVKALPALAPEVALIERVVALRAQVAAAPVAPKAPSKGAREQAIRLSATGALYATEFGKLAPQLEADFTSYVEGVFKRLAGKYQLRMVEALGFNFARSKGAPPGFERDASLLHDAEQYTQVVRQFLTVASLKGSAPQLDKTRLANEAREYAKRQIDQFVLKLTQKLGDLTDVAIRSVNAHGFEYQITGKLGERKVSVTQTRKFVVNQLGTMFHQWPALIYVDGKFTTEAAFKRLASAA